MRAVNLIPGDAKRPGGQGGRSISGTGSLGPSHFVITFLVIVVVLVVLRVLADNKVDDRKATLVDVQAQVATEQAQATQLEPFVTFVQQAQQREQVIAAIAKARFPWKTKFVELAHVLSASTFLTSLSGAISGAATSGTATTSAPAGTPTFSLAGCARTKNQNGTATLLRRLNQLPGVAGLSFNSSTREVDCGNNFSLTLSFTAIPGLEGSTSTASSGATTTTSGTTTTSSTTATATTTTETVGP